jgi:hypothetical protein
LRHEKILEPKISDRSISSFMSSHNADCICATYRSQDAAATNTTLSLAQKLSTLAAVHSWRDSVLSPTRQNRLKTKVWLNACRRRRAKTICQSARESHARCPDSGALGFPTKQNISNLRCTKGAQKWRMTTQAKYGCLMRPVLYLLGGGAACKACHKLPYFCLPRAH